MSISPVAPGVRGPIDLYQGVGKTGKDRTVTILVVDRHTGAQECRYTIKVEKSPKISVEDAEGLLVCVPCLKPVIPLFSRILCPDGSYVVLRGWQLKTDLRHHMKFREMHVVAFENGVIIEKEYNGVEVEVVGLGNVEECKYTSRGSPTE